MLRVSDGITNDILKEYFENATRFLVDEARDTLDSAATSKTTDSRLGDALDVVTQKLAVTLGAPFPQAFI